MCRANLAQLYPYSDCCLKCSKITNTIFPTHWQFQGQQFFCFQGQTPVLNPHFQGQTPLLNPHFHFFPCRWMAECSANVTPHLNSAFTQELVSFPLSAPQKLVTNISKASVPSLPTLKQTLTQTPRFCKKKCKVIRLQARCGPEGG